MMDDELKQYLAGLEQRFGERLDGRLDALEVRLKEHTAKAVTDMETRLISEFWKWGRSTDQRMHRLDVSDATTVDRVSNLEGRVSDIERRGLK